MPKALKTIEPTVAFSKLSPKIVSEITGRYQPTAKYCIDCPSEITEERMVRGRYSPRNSTPAWRIPIAGAAVAARVRASGVPASALMP